MDRCHQGDLQVQRTRVPLVTSLHTTNANSLDSRGFIPQPPQTEQKKVEAVGQPKSNPELGGALFHELGVEVTSLWKLKSTGEIDLDASTVPIREHVLPRFLHLVSATLLKQNSQSLVIFDGAPQLIVAAPIPSFPNEVLAAHYAKPVEDEPKIVDDLRRNVSLAAARLAVLRLEKANASLAVAQETQLRTKSEAEAQSNGPDQEIDWDTALDFMRAKFIGILKPLFSDVTNVAILAGICFLLGFIPFPHSVRCNAVCEPAVRRIVGAPFDGKLLDVHAKAGDKVTAGQLLAVMDGGEIRAEKASIQAKLAQAKQRRAAALTSRDASKAELERLEVQELKSELELLDGREGRLEIQSPIDGIVVVGDLERAKGAPLATGEDLFEIAPLEELVVEVAIPERDVSYVEEGMSLSVQLDAARGRTHTSELKSVHPRNEMLDNESVFIAEAEIPNSELNLRPGMSGVAKVHAGFKPLGWILFHRPFEALRKVVGW